MGVVTVCCTLLSDRQRFFTKFCFVFFSAKKKYEKQGMQHTRSMSCCLNIYFLNNNTYDLCFSKIIFKYLKHNYDCMYICVCTYVWYILSCFLSPNNLKTEKKKEKKLLKIKSFDFPHL